VSEPVWLELKAVMVLHDEQLAMFGGSPGMCDQGLLEAALARPRNAWGYGQEDVVGLAALYAAAIMRNHPFLDGNKRAGFLAACAFLYMNGLELDADEGEVVVQCYALAASEIEEEEFAAWLRANAQAR
jgi:death-on-curing protein